MDKPTQDQLDGARALVKHRETMWGKEHPMTGPSLHGIIGRPFTKDATEYRKGLRSVVLSPSPNGRFLVAAQPGPWRWFEASGHYPTRKAAIERIEALLSA
jgi:hypothetical protein